MLIQVYISTISYDSDLVFLDALRPYKAGFLFLLHFEVLLIGFVSAALVGLPFFMAGFSIYSSSQSSLSSYEIPLETIALRFSLSGYLSLNS
jgi:hypothetical protein